MSDYTKSTNFASKDSLAVGNPLKIVKGTEIDAEFNNIATAVATKADIASPTFTGTPVAPTATAGTNTTQLATTAFVGSAVSTAITDYDTALTVSTAQIEPNAVTNAKLASGTAVANLGFTPVQQGTGTGQLSNTVKIGWSGSQLYLTVDNTNFSGTWPIISETTTAKTLAATAGATAGAVGTYTYAGNTGPDVASNATTAGSNIGFTGTWRNMMPVTCFNSSQGFWLRVS